MKQAFFYLITIIMWSAMAFIVYFHSLPVPQGLGGVGVGLVYLVYIAVIAIGTLLLAILSKSNKQFFIFASVPVLFTLVNYIIMTARVN